VRVCFRSGLGFSCPHFTVQISFWVNDVAVLSRRTRPLSLQFRPSQIKSAAVHNCVYLKCIGFVADFC
jgi:hypothetical protein